MVIVLIGCAFEVDAGTPGPSEPSSPTATDVAAPGNAQEQETAGACAVLEPRQEADHVVLEPVFVACPPPDTDPRDPRDISGGRSDVLDPHAATERAQPASD